MIDQRYFIELRPILQTRAIGHEIGPGVPIDRFVLDDQGEHVERGGVEGLPRTRIDVEGLKSKTIGNEDDLVVGGLGQDKDAVEFFIRLLGAQRDDLFRIKQRAAQEIRVGYR